MKRIISLIDLWWKQGHNEILHSSVTHCAHGSVFEFKRSTITLCPFRSSREGEWFGSCPRRRRGPQGLVVFWRPGSELQCSAAVWGKPGARPECDGCERSCERPGSVWRHPGLQSGSRLRGHAVFSSGAKTGAGVQLPLRRPRRWFPQRVQGAPEVLQRSPSDPVPACVWTGGPSHPWQHEQGAPPLLPAASGPDASRWPFCSCCFCSQTNVPGLSQGVSSEKKRQCRNETAALSYPQWMWII